MHSFYELGSCSESYNFLQQVLSSKEQFHIENRNVKTISMAEAKAVAANKSHSEAERRRRKRINGHLATLRNLLPKTIKVSINFLYLVSFTTSISILLDIITIRLRINPCFHVEDDSKFLWLLGRQGIIISRGSPVHERIKEDNRRTFNSCCR